MKFPDPTWQRHGRDGEKASYKGFTLHAYYDGEGWRFVVFSARGMSMDRGLAYSLAAARGAAREAADRILKQEVGS